MRLSNMSVSIRNGSQSILFLHDNKTLAILHAMADSITLNFNEL